MPVTAITETGCLKDNFGTDLYATGKPIFEFEYPQGGQYNGLGSGLQYFSGGALTYPPTDDTDTTFFIVNLASTNTLPKDVQFTVGADAKALQDNFKNDGLTYELMPDSTFSLLKTAGTIKAGQHQDTFQVVFHPSRIDPTKNYMLPVTVTGNSDNLPVSGNFGHIYFHVIGNAIAGSYNWDFSRWNSVDGSGPLAVQSFTGGSTVFKPDNPNQVEVASGYYIQPRYVITFDNSGGTISNIQVSLNDADVAAMKANGVVVQNGPNIITADPVNHVYVFQYQVFNGSGYRYIVDKFYK